MALGPGLATTGLALAFCPTLYGAMGGEGASLVAATTYAGLVVGGAILVHLFNARRGDPRDRQHGDARDPSPVWAPAS